MAKYRCVILGCGPRAYGHARAYNLIERGELVTCCDLDAERREKFAGEFGIRAYADGAEMIRAEKPDLIHLVTPPRLRVELMTMVHDHKVPACIVEKPIAYEVRDWKALVALEAQSGTKFGVNTQVRYHPRLTRCRETLKSGKLGNLLFLDCSAGSTICDQGVHIIDWAMSLNDDAPVVRVFGAASGAKAMAGKQPSPDAAVGQLVFANGVRGMWVLGDAAPRVLADEAVWKHCRVAAHAERGRTLYEEFGKWEIASADGRESGAVLDMEAWAMGNDVAQANLTNAMFDWIEDDTKQVATSLKRSLEQWNVVLGLYASTVYRKPIDLPFDPSDDLWERLVEALA